MKAEKPARTYGVEQLRLRWRASRSTGAARKLLKAVAAQQARAKKASP